MKKSIPVACIVTAFLASCGGDSGSGASQKELISPTNADALNDALLVKVNGVTAESKEGTIPVATTTGSEPILAELLDKVRVQNGQKVVLQTNVDANSPLTFLFSKVTGASSYLEFNIATATKAQSALEIEITIPGNIRDGEFCQQFSAQDDAGRTSQAIEICFEVESTADDDLPPAAVAFTNAFVAGNTFSVSTDGDVEEFVFNSDGTGSVRFAPNPDNNFAEDDVNPITWSIDGNGRLLFTESDSGGDQYNWVLEATSISADIAAFNVNVTTQGESFSGSGTMQRVNPSAPPTPTTAPNPTATPVPTATPAATPAPTAAATPTPTTAPTSTPSTTPSAIPTPAPTSSAQQVTQALQGSWDFGCSSGTSDTGSPESFIGVWVIDGTSIRNTESAWDNAECDGSPRDTSTESLSFSIGRSVTAADGQPAHEITVVNQTEQTTNDALIVRVSGDRFQLGDRGPLTFFIEFRKQGADTAKACFNPVLWTTGTQYTATERELENGEVLAEYTSNYTVQGQGEYQGRPATVVYLEDPGGIPDANEYYQVDFSRPSVNSIADENLQGTNDSYTSDPGDLLRFDLSPGGSYTETTTFTSPEDGASTGPYTVTYIGRETITVPAGTFETCHFELTAAEGQSTYRLNEWYGVGNGLEIQETSSSGGPMKREELLDASINGVSVK